MKKKLIAIGIVLIVVGVIFVSVYGLSEQPEKADSFQSVTDSTGRFFSKRIKQYLEGNEKYRLLWYGTLTGYEPENPTLEVKDPDGNTLYSTGGDPSELPHTIDFWGNLSGVYTIDFNVFTSEDACYNIYKYVGPMEITHPYNILLSVGLLSVVSGAVVTVVCVARRK